MIAEKLARFWLSLGEIPSGKIQAILNEYGSAAAFYDAFAPNMERVLGKWAYQALDADRSAAKLMDKLGEAEKSGVRVAVPGEAEYPEALLQLYDPPAVIYLRGAQLNQGRRCFSIVGSRNGSRYGRDMAYAISRDLGKAGVAVVSGFARGTDTAAHQGCLAGGAPTAAVMGRGLDGVYPAENAALLQKLLDEGGCAMSEFPMGSRPVPWHFPQRNRLISALGEGILLVEGKISGGGMITVRLGLELGREIFALPGPANQEGSEAPHHLIREGARLAASARDILEDMGWDGPAMCDGDKPPELDGQEKRLFDLLQKEAMSFEELLEATGFAANVLNSHLTMMELKGIIKKCPGRIFEMA